MFVIKLYSEIGCFSLSSESGPYTVKSTRFGHFLNIKLNVSIKKSSIKFKEFPWSNYIGIVFFM